MFDLGKKKLWQTKKIFWAITPSFFDLEKIFIQINPPKTGKNNRGLARKN